VTFTVGAGDRWGIVGRNKSGKTSLFRLITGELTPVRGAIAKQPGLRVPLLDPRRDSATLQAFRGGLLLPWRAAPR